MAKIKGAIVVDTERCKVILCVVACPLHVIALTKEVNFYEPERFFQTIRCFAGRIK